MVVVYYFHNFTGFPEFRELPKHQDVVFIVLIDGWSLPPPLVDLASPTCCYREGEEQKPHSRCCDLICLPANKKMAFIIKDPDVFIVNRT